MSFIRSQRFDADFPFLLSLHKYYELLKKKVSVKKL